MADPKMTPVSSSTVHMVGYDPKEQELHVQFKSGPEIYVYSDFPAKKFGDFMNAGSKGLYHANEIKRHYAYTKKRPVPPQL